MPPQAAPKSPVSGSFIAGVQGEWSDTIMSRVPVGDAGPKRLAVSLASRTGGPTLAAVAPSAISSAASVR